MSAYVQHLVGSLEHDVLSYRRISFANTDQVFLLFDGDNLASGLLMDPVRSNEVFHELAKLFPHLSLDGYTYSTDEVVDGIPPNVAAHFATLSLTPETVTIFRAAQLGLPLEGTASSGPRGTEE